MTTHNRDKIISAAKEAGLLHTPNPAGHVVYDDQIEHFYASAFEAGRKADKNDAERYRFLREYMVSERTDLDDEFVSACSTNEPERLDLFIDSAIRARRDTK